jgi:hypothetical protein
VQSRYSRAGEGLVVTERTGDTIVIYTTDLNVYTLQDVLATYTVKLTAQLIE